MVCLRGQLLLDGPTCVPSLAEVASISVVDAEGLKLVCRSSGRIRLCCGDQAITLVGEIGVVVGSREDGALWDGRALRLLSAGDEVLARGMLRRHMRAGHIGYRDSAHDYTLEAFGGLATIDIAAHANPQGLPASMTSRLGSWAQLWLTMGTGKPVIATRHDDNDDL